MDTTFMHKLGESLSFRKTKFADGRFHNFSNPSFHYPLVHLAGIRQECNSSVFSTISSAVFFFHNGTTAFHLSSSISFPLCPMRRKILPTSVAVLLILLALEYQLTYIIIIYPIGFAFMTHIRSRINFRFQDVWLRQSCTSSSSRGGFFRNRSPI